jgi:hypothetical protein
MRNSRVFAALILGAMAASCAERMVSPSTVPKPFPPEVAPKPRLNNVEVRRQTERVAEDAGPSSGIRSVSQRARSKQQRPEQQAPPPQAAQRRQATLTGREAVAVLPPSTEPDESNFPFEALMPPPAEPAEPTFPSALTASKIPPPPEPVAPIQPEVPLAAAMPPPPDPAEPSFPVAALMPSPPEAAEPSLPSQEEIVAETPISIPLPDLPAYLSLRPRFEWVDTVGAIEVPREPMPDTSEVSPEKQIPALIQSPWPLSIETP